MFARSRSSAVAILLVLPAAVCSAAGTNDDAAALMRNSTCGVVQGSLVPRCNGAICTRGEVTGDLHGGFRTRVTSVYPGGSGWKYSAWLTIELAAGEGRIETLLDGVAPKDMQGGPDLGSSTEVLTISEATGRYHDYTGRLVVGGSYAVGKPTPYVGWMCHHP